MNESAQPVAEDRLLGAMFFKRVGELRDKSFVKVQRGARFDEISWREFGAQVRAAIFAFHSLELSKGDRVVIIGENSLEWLCADLAAIAGGFPDVIVSPTSSDSLFLKILNHSTCRAAFVQNEMLAQRLLHLKPRLPALNHLIVFDDSGGNLPSTLPFSRFLSLHRHQDDQRLHEILNSVQPDELATIMYTSGSTGEPKGVMRTQNNLMANITNGRSISLSDPDELTVILLSLNHLLGRFGFLKSAATGRSTAVIEATEQTVRIETIESLSPTALVVVPRVMETILEKVLTERGWRDRSGRLEELDRRRKQRAHLSSSEEVEFEELRAELRETIRKALGGRIKYITYSAAAMPYRTICLFELIGIPLLGSYGITECGGVTLSGIGDTKPGSLGQPFPNVELRIADDGELLVRGPTVTPGYFNDLEATRQAVDAEGWFHTGDLGIRDDQGCLVIVGRKKDTFNCADGSNIYPSRIEELLENDRFVRQAILLGDQRPFVASLIVPERKQIAFELNKPEFLLRNDEMETVIQSRVEQVNQTLEDHERVHKFVLMQSDFPLEIRTVTVLHKNKTDRKLVEERYKDIISAIYSPRSNEEKL